MGLESSGNVGRVGGNDVVDIPGKPGKGGKDSGPVGDEGPGKLSKLAALFRPLDTTGSLFTLMEPRSMLTVSVKSDFSCSRSWFLLSNTVNLFLNKLNSPCNSVSFLSACLAATQFS